MEVVIFLLGLIGGIVVSNLILAARTTPGCFKVDHSNPEKDVYRLEIKELDKIDKMQYMLLKIDHNADLSQK